MEEALYIPQEMLQSIIKIRVYLYKASCKGNSFLKYIMLHRDSFTKQQHLYEKLEASFSEQPSIVEDLINNFKQIVKLMQEDERNIDFLADNIQFSEDEIIQGGASNG